MTDALAPTLTAIRARIGERTPEVAMVLGSGLGGLAADLEDGIEIPYGDLQAFRRRWSQDTAANSCWAGSPAASLR